MSGYADDAARCPGLPNPADSVMECPPAPDVNVSERARLDTSSAEIIDGKLMERFIALYGKRLHKHLYASVAFGLHLHVGLFKTFQKRRPLRVTDAHGGLQPCVQKSDV